VEKTVVLNIHQGNDKKNEIGNPLVRHPKCNIATELLII
jgi:hypothetical protein